VTFAAPHLLFGLIALPLAAAGYWALELRRARRAAAWSRQAMLPNIVLRSPRRLVAVPASLFLLGLTFLLLGLARPEQVLGSNRQEPATIVLTFDVSGSMATHDVRPTRIGAARQLAIRFLNELPSKYRVAVVTFANNPRLVVAPTLDRASVIARLPTAVTARGGTAIGDAIGYAVAVIVAAAGQTGPGSLYRPGAVLLLSDGGQNAGGTTPEDAAVSALVDYIPVDAIAVGTPKATVSQPVKVDGQLFSNQIPVPVDPTTLQQVARQTGGAFFKASAVAQSPTPLKKVYEDLRSYTMPGRRTHELSAPAAGVALVFILAGIVLSGLWFGRVA
jgi:Ca-activated chloride channel family protein